ncbi:unnamed protein product [Adineta steineri]|uniref:Activator of Hsp90 ATPase AHSA1-like N-terminal domain-containing protein n=1 Tax=Adineta steineri TaxID=433720 RepID=A0A818KIA5_9BILA|nr:unnamed protein product [Adineta steineri]CAF3560897.1 unnamed protein product [Adineta steineri]
MAEWGKGDPRWIVEDRPDATNPNNWHWKEKNATQWSKDKLKELLVGLKIENEEQSCEIKDLSNCTGEATANNRKAKLVFIYEWQIRGTWEGTYLTGDNRTKYEGSFEIPNLSDENEIHEVTITFSVEKSKGDKLKEMMRKEGEPIVREKLAEYIRSLKEEFSQGLILPTKTNSNAPTTQSKSSINTSNKIPITQLPTGQNNSGVVEVRDVKVQDTFKCTKVDLFKAFCDIDRVKAFTQNSVTRYDCKKGGFFSIFSDNITGRFVDIVPYERVDMLWRFKSWPSDHYSRVALLFQDDTDQTKLVIEQTGVPVQFYENTKDGWKRFYINSIKTTFGYGSSLF